MWWKVIIGLFVLVFVAFLCLVMKMAKTEAEEFEHDLREADKYRVGE
jgi:hypothetical protein